ncbi:hypothetical protein H8D30_06760, partial [bacterium]|nr:hypothetical protein [bacterium]
KALPKLGKDPIEIANGTLGALLDGEQGMCSGRSFWIDFRTVLSVSKGDDGIVLHLVAPQIEYEYEPNVDGFSISEKIEFVTAPMEEIPINFYELEAFWWLQKRENSLGEYTTKGLGGCNCKKVNPARSSKDSCPVMRVSHYGEDPQILLEEGPLEAVASAAEIGDLDGVCNLLATWVNFIRPCMEIGIKDTSSDMYIVTAYIEAFQVGGDEIWEETEPASCSVLVKKSPTSWAWTLEIRASAEWRVFTGEDGLDLDCFGNYFDLSKEIRIESNTLGKEVSDALSNLLEKASSTQFDSGADQLWLQAFSKLKLVKKARNG